MVAEQKTTEKSGLGLSAPLLLLLLGGLAGLGWITYQHWQADRLLQAEQARQARAVAQLADTPGIVLTDVQPGPSRLRIRGLRDPLSADPQALLVESGLQIEGLELAWRPYQAAEPGIALRRAKQRLAPPASVRLDLNGRGLLSATGSANQEWTNRARILALTVPGITDADFSSIATPDEILLKNATSRLRPPATVTLRADQGQLTIAGEATANWIDAVTDRLTGTPHLKAVDTERLTATEEQVLTKLRTQIEAAQLWFAQGSTALNDTSQATLTDVAKLVSELNALASALDRRAVVTLVGRTDGIGDLTRNEHIAQGRAEQAKKSLVDLGIPDASLRTKTIPLPAADERFSPKLRRVEFHLTITPVPASGQPR